MDNRPVILHNSPIIRAGITGYIREIYDGEIITFAQKEDLKNLRGFNGVRFVIFIEDLPGHEDLSAYLSHLSRHSPPELIFICTVPPDGSHDQHGKKCLFLHDTEANIKETICSAVIRNKSSRASENIKSENTLTVRETEVLKMVALGKTNKEIASELFISIHTVISHRKNITEKLGIKSISGLTVYAIINRLIDTNTIDPESLI